MKILNCKTKEILFILLTIWIFLFPITIYSEISNTTEITVKPDYNSIDAFLEKEIDKNKEYNSPEELLKKANELLNLVDYFKERKDRDVIKKIMLSIEEIYKEGLSKYPANIRIYDDYGAFLYDYKGDYINSVQLWEQGYKLDEKDASINNNLALHYFHIGEYDKGWDYLQNALKYGENESNILYNSAQIFIIYRNQIQERTGWDKEKIYKKAMEYSEKAVKISPNDFELLKDYALNFFAAVQFYLP
ncbi:MAG: tetratricopeptide repeat protein, partial [Candidatus Hydrogenedens sp.]